MSLSAIVAALVDAGATPQMILAAVRAHEDTASDALTARRDSDARRQQAKRDRENNVMSRYVTVTDRDAVTAPASPPFPPRPPPPTPTPPDITTRARGGASKPNGFARFWEAYPHKVGKSAAEKAYVRAIGKIGGHDPPSVLLAGVERAKASREWGEGFIPHPTTWLNQGRWEDEPAEVIHLQPRKAHERPHHNAKFEQRQANLAAHERGFDIAAGFSREP